MKKHIINYIYVFVLQFGNYLFPLVTLPIVSRIFGPDLIGDYNYATLLAGYACLVISYGFNYTGVRRLSRNRNDKSKIFYSIFYCQLIFLFLSTILICILAYTLNYSNSFKILFFICYLSCITTIFQQSWVFQVHNDFRIITIISLLTKLVSLILILLVVKNKGDLNIYASILQVTMLFSAISSFIIAIRKYNIRFYKASWSDLANFYKEDFYIFAVNVLGNLYTSTSIVILGLLTNSYNVGIYTAAQKVVDLLINFSLLPLNTLLLPLLSERFGKDRGEGIKLVNKLFPLFIGLAVSALVITLFFGKYIISIGFGPAFIESTKILNILLVGFFFVFFGYILGGQVILNLGYDKSFVKMQVVIAIASILCNLLFAKGGGAERTAYIWSFCEFIMTMSQFVFLHKKGVKVIDFNYFRPKVIIFNIKSIINWRNNA